MISRTDSVRVSQNPELGVKSPNEAVQRISKEKLGHQVEENARESKAKPISEKQLEKAIEGLNSTLEILDRGLRFDVHKETDRMIVQVVDKGSDEVIREIPPEKMLDLLAQIRDLVGIVVDEKA